MEPHDLETARLHLRPVTPEDACELHALWTHALVRRFLWDDVEIPIEQTRGVIETSRELFARRGFGLWVATRREAADLIGFAGFWLFRDPPELELLYGVAAGSWGEGVATEMAGAVIRYGFAELVLAEIRACTDAPNLASMRVMEKLGMRFDRRAVQSGLDTVFYRLARPAELE